MYQIIRRISKHIPYFAKTLLVILLVTSAPTHSIEIHKGGNDGSPLLAGTPSDGTVRLSSKIQKMAGIVARSVELSRYRHEKKAFGKVVALGPLIELSELYRSASAAERASSAQQAIAESSYRRLRGLFDDKVISKNRLEKSKTDWIAARAAHETAATHSRSLRLKTLQDWGAVVTEWALEPDNSRFHELVLHQSFMVAVSLPHGETLPTGTRTVFTHNGANRDKATAAYLISPAPTTSEQSQGESYFFLTKTDSIRIGMHLRVWIPSQAQVLEGFRVPLSAVVWRDGKAWVYRKIGNSSFRRLSINNGIDLGTSWFIEKNDEEPIGEIVISGGQTLLSQEFHWQIPDEDEH